jgi:hypothetical protein
VRTFARRAEEMQETREGNLCNEDVIIDCDPGQDEAIAILRALGSPDAGAHRSLRLPLDDLWVVASCLAPRLLSGATFRLDVEGRGHTQPGAQPRQHGQPGWSAANAV